MFGIGMMELSIILIIVLIIFGAGKLPEIGHGLGKCIRNFKKGVAGDNEPTLPDEHTTESQKKIENKP
ncbi:MAG: twin-arginine translocase TatA/TatE family subunit [bacterium]